MKKIIITFFAIISVMTSVSAAGISEGVRIGIGASKTEINGTGTERLRDGSGLSTANKGGSATLNTSEDTTVGHVFAEKSFSNGFTLGVEYIPGEADISGVRTRTDDDIETTGNNKASATAEKHYTIYGIMPVGTSPLFVKAGVISMDIITNEVLATGSTYGNATVNGVTLGVGAHLERDNGLFIRAELNMSEYENISITSSGSNIVSADLDTTQTKLSIGKTF